MNDPDELFRSTATYYARHRPGYPPAFFDHLRHALDLDGSQTVLDLGCGTGQVAIPLAPAVGRVIAVDPLPDMLAWGRRRAAEHAAAGIDWRVGDSTKLAALELPPLDVVTMGASFHWMDRREVLEVLDRLVVDDGALVVASGQGPPLEEEQPAWIEVIRAVRSRFLGPERRAGRRVYTHPQEGHAAVLARSPFSEVETAVWRWEIVRDLDSLVELQLSYSFSAPALLGRQTGAFVRQLREALEAHHPEGRFVDRIRTEASIARRP